VGRLSGKVALITGAARGQGRSHAMRLAEEGADVVAVDICAPLATAMHSAATPEDLAQTAKLVEDRDRRVLARIADVRDLAAMNAVVAEAVAEFGHIDVVCANAGIASFAPSWKIPEQSWQEMIDINLTGVWKTTTAVIPSMIEAGRGGSIIITSSTAGMAPFANTTHYAAAKHGVVGLMRGLAVELAQHGIRVNTVHPTTVDTPMIDDRSVLKLFLPDSENPTKEEASESMKVINAVPVPWVEAVDISNAVLFLASDEARYITGTQLPVDAGALMPFKIPNL